MHKKKLIKITTNESHWIKKLSTQKSQTGNIKERIESVWIAGVCGFVIRD